MKPDAQNHRQWKRFFDAFGFLFLPGAMGDDIEWIDAEFEAALAGSGRAHDGSERTSFSDEILRSEPICALVENRVINRILSALLGDDFIYLGTGADIYVGDSQWHPDMHAAAVPHLKLALYLDPLTSETGALRVVPGSHLQGFKGNLDTGELWGLSPRDVPCWSPDSRPGDVAVFNLHTLHNALGGGSRRRMLNFVACADCRTPEQLAYLDERIGHHRGPVYSDVMVSTATPERMRHLERILDRERALGRRP